MEERSRGLYTRSSIAYRCILIARDGHIHYEGSLVSLVLQSCCLQKSSRGTPPRCFGIETVIMRKPSTQQQPSSNPSFMKDLRYSLHTLTIKATVGDFSEAPGQCSNTTEAAAGAGVKEGRASPGFNSCPPRYCLSLSQR